MKFLSHFIESSYMMDKTAWKSFWSNTCFTRKYPFSNSSSNFLANIRHNHASHWQIIFVKSSNELLWKTPEIQIQNYSLVIFLCFLLYIWWIFYRTMILCQVFHRIYNIAWHACYSWMSINMTSVLWQVNSLSGCWTV